MKQIPLTKGLFALVDDKDYEVLNKYKWYADDKGKNQYAGRSVGPFKAQKRIHMHREILGTPDGLFTDHIDGNGLNNQRANLRIVTNSQNVQNGRLMSNNTSGYKGVSWNTRNKRFHAQIRKDGVVKFLGAFKDPKQAHEAYLKAGKELFGEYFRLE